jgi:hypothetical protein
VYILNEPKGGFFVGNHKQGLASDLLLKLKEQDDAIVEALVRAGMSREQAEAQRKAFGVGGDHDAV